MFAQDNVQHTFGSNAEMDIAIRQFDNVDMPFQEKNKILKWQNTLVDRPGMGTMIYTLEMIVKFSIDIIKEYGIEVPPRMQWMD